MKKKCFSILFILVLGMGLILPLLQNVYAAAPKQPLEEGTYKIKAGVGSNMYLDVAGGSKQPGANIQIWKDDDVEQQQFNVKKLSDGYYKITAVHSKCSLDVDNSGKVNGTNVKQYTDTGGAAQEWEIRQVSGGYNIVSKCNGLCLDISNGSSANGTNVQMYKGNNTSAQKFTFEKINPIADGIYKIKAGIGTNEYLDIDGGSKQPGANLQIWQGDNVDQQKFKITWKNGYYKIIAVHSNCSLDVDNAGKANGTNVKQYKDTGGVAQEWTIKQVSGGYNIISRCNGLCLDISNGSYANGTNVQMYQGNGTNAQKFNFEKTTTVTPSPSPTPSTNPKDTKELADGDYMIKTCTGNQAFDIQDRSTRNEANLQIWVDDSKNLIKNKQFHISKQKDGTYTIMAAHSGKVLDVSGAGKTNGTNVAQYETNGTDAQKWYIKDAGKGLYEIISKCNNLALDVKDGKIGNGANMQVWSQNHSNAQKFKIEKTEVKQVLENGIYEIKMKKDTNKRLDISAGSTANGASVQIWDKDEIVNQQKFKITYDSKKDNYKIEAVHSGKVLDVPNAEAKNNVKIQQYQSNDSDAQRWKIKAVGDGTYNIISEIGGLYLDVTENKTSNGTRLQLYQKNESTDAQKFIIENALKVGYNDFEDLSIYTNIPDIKSALDDTKARHPKWDINLYYTGLDWNAAIDGEFQMVGASPRSLTQKGNQWRVDATRYDVSKSWYRASKAAIAYMMDPRNSFEDEWIFQFQDISSSSGTYSDVQKMVKGSFIDNSSCINAILEAAKANSISPFHLASRIIQESGSNGSSVMNGYSYKGKTVYNLFNINVSGNDGGGIQRGAEYAYNHGWFSKEASIKGGASFLRDGYLSVGQTTAYFQKYNVVQQGNLYNHQYMQNIHAANSEGNSIYNGYKKAGLVDLSFSFAIPLYDNMPTTKAPRPLE